jgi:hypothetical protein
LSSKYVSIENYKPVRLSKNYEQGKKKPQIVISSLEFGLDGPPIEKIVLMKHRNISFFEFGIQTSAMLHMAQSKQDARQRQPVTRTRHDILSPFLCS